MTNFVASFTPGSSRDNFSGFVGSNFNTKVGLNFTITALGSWVLSGGQTGTRTVYVCIASSGTISSILVQATVTLTSAPSGAFTYQSVTPTALPANTQIYLLAQVTNADGISWSDTAAVTYTSGLLNTGITDESCFHIGGSTPVGTSPANQTAHQQYIGLDIQGSVASSQQIVQPIVLS